MPNPRSLLRGQVIPSRKQPASKGRLTRADPLGPAARAGGTEQHCGDTACLNRLERTALCVVIACKRAAARAGRRRKLQKQPAALAQSRIWPAVRRQQRQLQLACRRSPDAPELSREGGGGGRGGRAAFCAAPLGTHLGTATPLALAQCGAGAIPPPLAPATRAGSIRAFRLREASQLLTRARALPNLRWRGSTTGRLRLHLGPGNPVERVRSQALLQRIRHSGTRTRGLMRPRPVPCGLLLALWLSLGFAQAASRVCSGERERLDVARQLDCFAITSGPLQRRPARTSALQPPRSGPACECAQARAHVLRVAPASAPGPKPSVAASAASIRKGARRNSPTTGPHPASVGSATSAWGPCRLRQPSPAMTSPGLWPLRASRTPATRRASGPTIASRLSRLRGSPPHARVLLQVGLFSLH